MKLDMELAREILLELENRPHGFARGEVTIAGHSEEEIGYHIHLLGQAGLLEVCDVAHSQSPSPCAIPISVTFAGHQFSASAKNETLWKKAGAVIAKQGLSMTFELVGPLLIKLAKDQLGLGTTAGQ